MNFSHNSAWLPRAAVLAPALVLAVGAPARAQDPLAAPAGWTKSYAAGDLIYTQSGSGCRLVVQKLVPLTGGLPVWFATQLARDNAKRGKITSPGLIQAQDKSLTLMRSFSLNGRAQTVIYVGYAVGNQGRLLAFSGPNQAALVTSVGQLNALGAKLGAQDEARMRGAQTGSTQTNKAQPVRGNGGTSQGKGVPPGKLAPVAARGTLKSSQMLGVYLLQSYTTGVGGMVVITFEPVLVLRDGSARRELEVPPTDLNLAGDKSANSKDWGTWKRQGDKMVVRWKDGDTDDLKLNYKTRPAQAGQTIAQAYSSLGGGGNTAMGGSVMTFYSNRYAFTKDGRFTTEKSGGGGTPSVTALSKSKTAGRYRLDGHALTLRFNDGRTVRRLFYFYPDGNRVLGIGDDSFVIED